MKEYMKPELEYVDFVTETIADIGSGDGIDASNDFGDSLS